MMVRLAAGLLVHFFACVIYVVVNYYGVSLYKFLFGGLTSRGASIGIAMYMVFYLFVFVNLVVAVIPKRMVKVSIVFLMVALILVYLLPLYPVRAAAYSVLTGGLTILAIWLAGKLDKMLLARVMT
ncbi:hypothetical protein [Pseudomonas sp. GM30]|uniref:hypothetical protein n=1 Tax=Pseudomonas sp. GM30 TaxID=1144328 RepID=UPI00026FEA0F|nr:hypothetical protein [Pseudomonas sp. GM30]EUB83689.1 hypothetical protein PMI25_002350 [Pseudomonas sp. GM30]